MVVESLPSCTHRKEEIWLLKPLFTVADDQETVWSEMKLNKCDLCQTINSQEFAGAIIQALILLKFNLNLKNFTIFIIFFSSVNVVDW